MNIDLSKLWAQAQDLNFGQITEVLNAAVQAAEDKIHEIRKDKFIAAGAPVTQYWDDHGFIVYRKAPGQPFQYHDSTRWALSGVSNDAPEALGWTKITERQALKFIGARR